MKKRLGIGMAGVALSALWVLRTNLDRTSPMAVPAVEGKSIPARIDAPEIRFPIAEACRRMLPILTDSPTAAPDPHWAIRVHCVDARERALAGARVFLRSDETVETMATTDENGLATLVTEPRLPRVLIAQHEGSASARRVLLSRPLDPIEFRLRQEAALSGVVELEGGPVSGGLAVIAVPERLNLAVARMAVTRLMNEPEIVVGRTDSAGRFHLSGLEPSGAYQIVAGGMGYLQAQPEHVLVTDGQFLRLHVEHAYALRLRFLESSGEPAHVEQGYGPNGAVSAQLEVRSATLMADDSLPARLALLGNENALLPNEKLYLAASPSEVPALEPLHVQADFAGYAPLDLRLPMGPISSSSAETAVQLESLGRSWGELEVLVTAPEGLEDRSRRFGPRATLHLSGEDGTKMSRAVDGELFGRHRFRDIPSGRYHVTLRGEPRTWKLPADERESIVEIGPGTALISFSPDFCGAAILDLRAPSGEAFDGEAVFFLGLGPPEAGKDGRTKFSGSEVFFERPPYFLPLLEPGCYSALVARPASSETWRTFTVVAGEATSVVLRSSH